MIQVEKPWQLYGSILLAVSREPIERWPIGSHEGFRSARPAAAALEMVGGQEGEPLDDLWMLFR